MQKIPDIRKTGNILFAIASLVLLLHNITPHFHHGEISETQHDEEHQDAESLLDWLALTFHSDLGEGHMECFSQVNHLDSDVQSQVFLIPDFLLNEGIQQGLIKENQEDFNLCINRRDKLHPQYFYSDSPLRAPPLYA